MKQHATKITNLNYVPACFISHLFIHLDIISLCSALLCSCAIRNQFQLKKIIGNCHLQMAS